VCVLGLQFEMSGMAIFTYLKNELFLGHWLQPDGKIYHAKQLQPLENGPTYYYSYYRIGQGLSTS
jgi:hypothetical protein